jgi:hypothetical protein
MESEPVLFVAPGDTLYAFEGQRLLTFDQQMRSLDTRRVDVSVTTTAIFTGNEIVVDGHVHGSDRRIFPINMLNRSGALIRSVGSVADTMAGGTLMGPARTGGFWSLAWNGSEVQHRSANGQVTRTVRINRKWFPANPTRSNAFVSPPQPANNSITEVAPGRLLVVTLVADAAWKPAPANPNGSFRPADTQPSAIWDSIVDLVDATTGAVISTKRFPEALFLVRSTNNEFHTTIETELGHISVIVWRVVIRSDGTRGQ